MKLIYLAFALVFVLPIFCDVENKASNTENVVKEIDNESLENVNLDEKAALEKIVLADKLKENKKSKYLLLIL